MKSVSIENLQKHLKNIFGFDSFRENQLEIISAVLNKQDCLGILPTGSGKSLCYQLPAIVSEGIAIVISPLISLMEDQVLQLNQLGSYAVLLNSSLSRNDYYQNIKLLKTGHIKLLYLAPETLFKESIIELLKSLNISFVTVDEAHCISEWGHDFRPEYMQLAVFREIFKNIPFLALTATATKKVREDIALSLKMKNYKLVVASFDRPNLFLEVKQKQKPFKQLTDFLEKFKDESGIIYCFSRKQADSLYLKLSELGFAVKPYHAGLTSNERKLHQKMFVKDDVKIITATIAFGMGINKPDVRFVVHYDLPKNIESYYQEIGRAGRDSLPAHCLLLLGYGDISKIKYLIEQKPNEDLRRIANIHLSTMLQYAETKVCRRIPLLNYFSEQYVKENCNNCDNCVNKVKEEVVNLTVEAQKFMSCMKRTGEYFGITHIVDILRGSKSEKVLKLNHNKLSTYGIGKDLTKKQWQHIARQLIQNNVIEQDARYGSLKLTAKAWEILKGKVEFKGYLIKEVEKAPKKKEKLFGTTTNYDRQLFQTLRQLRKQIADSENLPPYIIFPDKTLINLSSYHFTHIDQLKEVHGIGVAKFNKYGKAFYKAIEEYYEQYPESVTMLTKPKIEPSTKQIKTEKPETTAKKTKTSRQEEIITMLNNGTPISKIANHYGIKIDTVVEHITKHISNGNTINNTAILSSELTCTKEQFIKAFNLFKNSEDLKLKPVFQALNEKVSYTDLRIIKSLVLHGKISKN